VLKNDCPHTLVFGQAHRARNSDPSTQGEMQAIVNKLDELITAQRR
jgi:hypothetical protein